MADLDNSRSPTPPPRARRTARTSPTRAPGLLAPDIESREERRDTVPKLIAAHKQPGNATHLLLEKSDYLAAGDVHVREDAPQQQPTPTSPRDFPRVHRTVHLVNASLRLQEVVGDVHDEHEERWQTTETAEQFDARLRLVEDEVYTVREAMSIKYLKDHHVPLLYNPINLRSVQHNPERHQGMLRPFYKHPPMDFDAPMNFFFERQSLRWQEFIRFQAHNRGLQTMDEPFLEKAYAAALLREATCGSQWRHIYHNWKVDHSEGRYAEYVDRRKDEMILLRDQDCDDFDDYQAAVVARLDRNGVRRLDKNNAELPGLILSSRFWDQDPMTTWTEYLAYEYWQMEQYDDDVDKHQPEHDGAYQRLESTVTLGGHETADFLATEDAKLQRRVELDEAYAQFDEATLNFVRLEQRRVMWRSPGNTYMMHHRRTRMLAEAQAELEAAEAAKDAAVRREEQIKAFLHETETYREARDIRARHNHLLAWARSEYDRRMGETLATSVEEPGEPSSRRSVSFQLPSNVSAESVTQEREASDTDQEAQDATLLSSLPPAVAEVESRSDDEHQGGVGSSCDASFSSAVGQSELVETLPGKPAAVEREPVEQTEVVIPTAGQSPSGRDLSVAPAVAGTTETVPPANTSAGPRRSARIAAARGRAAEKTALQSTQTSRRSETSSKRAGAKGGRKRGGSKVVAEETVHDAEPPAKRTRRRTVRK
ncbi:hypothetical protein LLEC1_03035 [Akanthomyces lecanii]|uniref:Uncharacterized protein n=1 Tax=Cordyceps confragosa TaxID=2714763 RepID=A0A179ICV5_CORDF|nr:hypothetical protein LLEC1_03035 [Akanthomyces lecanii]